MPSLHRVRKTSVQYVAGIKQLTASSIADFTLQQLNFEIQSLILSQFVPQKLGSQIRFLRNSQRSEQIHVRKLFFVFMKIVNFDKPFAYQCFKAVVGLPETYPQNTGKFTLTAIRILDQKSQNFQVIFLLESRHKLSNLLANNLCNAIAKHGRSVAEQSIPWNSYGAREAATRTILYSTPCIIISQPQLDLPRFH